MKSFTRRAAVASVAALAVASLAACGSGSSSSSSGSDSKSPVYFGVSAAETGQYATYGTQFKEAFTLAAEQVNAKGGINGHPVKLKYEDSQSDPKQSVPVAQKFVGDKSIILVFGDYSSGASIPASPVYTAGKLVQYGFNNSNPDFTAKGSEYQWSSSITATSEFAAEADSIKQQGISSVGVTYLNTSDWGVPVWQAFQAEAKKIGLTITDAEAVDPNADDYKPSLIKATQGDPKAFVHIGYGPDGAKVITQLRTIGFKGQFWGGQDDPSYNTVPDAADSISQQEFDPSSTDPTVQAFVKAFEAKYPSETTVTSFEAGAYDAFNVAVAAAKAGGTTRAGVLKGFKSLKGVPSTIYGTITFDQATRRVANPKVGLAILKDGKWTPYSGN